MDCLTHFLQLGQSESVPDSRETKRDVLIRPGRKFIACDLLNCFFRAARHEINPSLCRPSSYLASAFHFRGKSLIVRDGKFKTCVEARVCRMQAQLVLSGLLLDSIFLGAIRSLRWWIRWLSCTVQRANSAQHEPNHSSLPVIVRIDDAKKGA